LSIGAANLKWVPGDVERMTRWLVETQAAQRRPRRILALSASLLVLSFVAYVYLEHSVARSRWALIPIVAVWASATVSAATTVIVVAGWRILRIIRRGLAEAQQALEQPSSSDITGAG
jgi:hypothetical protein